MSRADDGSALARDLLQVMLRMMRSMSRQMRQSPQAVAPAHVAALMRLKTAPATTSDLARHLGVRVPTITRSIDVLVERGWVAGRPGSADRRQTIVRLTPAGRRTAAAMRRKAEQHIASLLAPLSAQQRTQLRSTLDVLNDVLPPVP